MRISDWSSDVCSSDLRPAIRIGGRRGMVAAADEVNDFQLVAIGQDHISIGRTRHHLQIALDRDLGGIKLKLADKLGKGCAGCNPPRFAVDAEGEGEGNGDRKSTRLNSSH